MIAVVLISTLLLALGVVLAVVWDRLELREPEPRPPATTRSQALRDALRRYVWWANVATIAAVVSGALAGAAGGRLVMRIIALAAPPSAQGRLTEAGEVVGRATITAFVPLFLFTGLVAGFLGAFVYVLARRWLPSGWWTGPALGLLLLVVFGPLIDPLRSDNRDFAILGPNWLAVLLFTVLAVVGGSLVVAVARWASHRIPALSGRTFPAYLPLLVPIVFFPAGALLILGAIVLAAATVAMPPGRPIRVPQWAGRAVLVVAALLALPVFIGSLTKILAMG